MSKGVKFGFSVVGDYTVVKLNIKLDTIQIDKLKRTYGTLSFIDIGSFGCRIEGVLQNYLVKRFFGYDLKRAKLISEVLRVNSMITQLDNAWEPDSTCWTKANLNEI